MDITLETIKHAAPKSVRSSINQELVDTINNVSEDEQFRDAYRNNLIGFINVLQDSRYKITDYINATKYASYKLMGNSNIQAYTKTFPDRFQRLIGEGASDKDISAYVAAYNKNQLVNKIIEQSMVPTHVLNSELFQKAINTQANIMSNPDASYKVRSDAANSLLTHLKPPESAKLEIDMTIKQDSALDDLRKATQQLVNQQKQMLEEKVINAKDVAESRIIEDAQYEEVN